MPVFVHVFSHVCAQYTLTEQPSESMAIFIPVPVVTVFPLLAWWYPWSLSACCVFRMLAVLAASEMRKCCVLCSLDIFPARADAWCTGSSADIWIGLVQGEEMNAYTVWMLL